MDRCPSKTIGPWLAASWRIEGPLSPPCSQAALPDSSAPSQGLMCTNKTPEVTASPSVKMKVLQEGSEPQLLLALSEAWGGPLGGHLRGQGACTSLLKGGFYEAWLGHPAAACDGVQIAVVLVCRWSLSAFAALGRQLAPWLHESLPCHQR